MENTKLTKEQQEEFLGAYDTLASYFGGDPIVAVEEKYYQNDKLGYLTWMRNTLRNLKSKTRNALYCEIKMGSKKITSYYSK
tara:strand:+ start:1702 stop:1947 length:246 start_codon:yes stop_codon:yes gene_type:complete